jgi:triacylglycerol lipase
LGRLLDNTLAILNGAVGDYLARTDNGLAITASLIHEGRPLRIERDTLASVFGSARSRVVVLLHGLMCTEDFWRNVDGNDFGGLLARDLGHAPLYLRYNTGLAIADNGAALCRLLDDLVEAWPGELEEILLLGHSMGGLVIRSACHLAGVEGAPWLGRVRGCIYVGTPHRGAPLERAGKTLAKLLYAVDDPYTRLTADLANLRSAGIRDLGDPRHPVPLLSTTEHLLIAGTIVEEPMLDELFGDCLVPLSSATDRKRCDPVRSGVTVEVFPGFDHLALARRSEVYECMRTWCERTR